MSTGPTIRVLNEDISNFHHWRKTAKTFTETTGIQVEFEYLWLNDYWQAIISSYTDRAGEFDVVAADEMLLPLHARRGAVLPLDNWVQADGFDLSPFNPAAIDCATVDSKLYGIPYSNMSNILVYRADLFDRYGFLPPRTLTELYDVAIGLRKALVADGETDTYGLIARGKPGAGANVWILGSSIAPAFGARLYDEEGHPAFDSPEMVAALSYYADLIQQSAPPDSERIDWYNGSERYFQGEAAMFIEAASEIAKWYDLKSPVAELSKVTLIPAGPGGDRHAGLYAPAWNIPAASRHPEAAWQFIRWAASPEPAAIDLTSGHLEQARLSALTDPRAKQVYPADLVDAVITTRAFARNERTIEDAWLPVGDAFGEAIAEAISGRLDAKSALSKAQAKIVEIHKHWQ
ncbi:MAG: sugar ABC transporter substrate-binding protein [Caldilineales bacterium]|nr:sugar ABC transporter substrate-binding protein [Caldilineales bacterium]